MSYFINTLLGLFLYANCYSSEPVLMMRTAQVRNDKRYVEVKLTKTKERTTLEVYSTIGQSKTLYKLFGIIDNFNDGCVDYLDILLQMPESPKKKYSDEGIYDKTERKDMTDEERHILDRGFKLTNFEIENCCELFILK